MNAAADPPGLPKRKRGYYQLPVCYRDGPEAMAHREAAAHWARSQGIDVRHVWSPFIRYLIREYRARAMEDGNARPQA